MREHADRDLVNPDQKRARGASQWAELGVLLLAGNLANLVSWRLGYPINSGPVTIVLACALYAYIGPAVWRERRYRMHALRRPLRSFVFALGAAAALTAPSLVFLWISATHGGLHYPQIQSLSVHALLVRVLVEIPLLTALVEELVFRQYLLVRFASSTTLRTLAGNVLIFTLWHLVVTLRTVMDTSYARDPWLLALSYLGALGTIAIGGAVFALVRLRTGSFLWSALSHWATDALLTIATWLL
ncbi:MAG TPA: CPBP family intramembrane glutamic endopeptidase [Ktedonobacterales bacterium]|jgi:membrane protease YdiL (CAAX protease family)|nr:CPBP family intramembrane glutamic endopeptidase [Ktedonobacterales bacterium]